MLGSLKLGKLFGIDLYLHGTFWLLPLFVIFTSLGESAIEIGLLLLFVFAVFACIALHELGHALAAAYYGIRTRHITLYPIGGIAALERMPSRPLHEVVVALAGPAVNVLIAAGLLTAMVLANLVFIIPGTPTSDPVSEFVARLLLANVVLCVFNLLPAFPMDGGRVLRALLSIKMNRLRATEIAVRVGTVVAIGLFLTGLAYAALSLIVIAVVVWLLGQAELGAIRMMAARQEFERRASELFGGIPDHFDSPTMPADTTTDLTARRFSGLAWDTDRRVWVQWLDGVPVRDIPA